MALERGGCGGACRKCDWVTVQMCVDLWCLWEMQIRSCYVQDVAWMKIEKETT